MTVTYAVTIVLILAILAPPCIANTSRLVGQVTFSGSPASGPSLTITKSHEVCGDEIPDERIQVSSEGHLANVVVIVHGVAPNNARTPGARASVLVTGCRYSPRIQAVSVGATLELRNLDPIPHDIVADRDGEEELFQASLPFENRLVLQRMKRPGVVSLRCNDGHYWASASVVVTMSRHYAVTGADGSFAIDDVPPGTYRVEAWHESLGRIEESVVVAEEEDCPIVLRFRRR